MSQNVKKMIVVTGILALFILILDYISAVGLRMLFFLLQNKDDIVNMQDGHVPNTFLEYLINPLETLTYAMNEQLYMVLQILFIALFLYGAFRTYRKLRSHKLEDASVYGAFGTTRFAEEDEVFDKKGEITNNINEDGTLLGRFNNKFIVKKEKGRLNSNVFAVGGSGSGKTQAYILLNILNTTTKSIVVTDPKGELYELTSKQKETQGYEIRLINFSNMKLSDFYSPLTYSREEQDAEKFATTLVMAGNEKGKTPDFWEDQAISLITAGILYVQEKYQKNATDLYTMASVYTLLTEPNEEELKKLFADLPQNSSAKIAFASVKNAEEKTWSGIVSSANRALKLWKLKTVREFTSQSNFELSDLGKRKIALYVVIPVADTTYRSLINTFFSQLFQELYAYADKNHNKLDVKVKILLDEFANIGKIPNFAERLSTTRSYGIEVSVIAQSIGQINDRYGKEQTDEIIGNCDMFIFLGTNATATAKEVSEKIGVTTKRMRNESHNLEQWDNGQHSYSYISRALMTPDELLRLPKDECIISLNGMLPIRAEKAWAYQYLTDFYNPNHKDSLGWHLEKQMNVDKVTEEVAVSPEKTEENEKSEKCEATTLETEVEAIEETEVQLPEDFLLTLSVDQQEMKIEPIDIEEDGDRVYVKYELYFKNPKNGLLTMTQEQFEIKDFEADMPVDPYKEGECYYLELHALQSLEFTISYREKRNDLDIHEEIRKKQKDEMKKKKASGGV